MQHFVWFRREETEKTALFEFEATIWSLFTCISLHRLDLLSDEQDCHVHLSLGKNLPRVTPWTNHQFITGPHGKTNNYSHTHGHTPTHNPEFSNWPHMHVCGLCEEYANSTQKGQYEPLCHYLFQKNPKSIIQKECRLITVRTGRKMTVLLYSPSSLLPKFSPLISLCGSLCTSKPTK